MLVVLKPLWIVIQGLLAMAVCGWAIDYYDPSAFDYHVPLYFYHIVLVGIFSGSVFWLLSHLVGGSLFGMAAGGFWDGIKLGMILGFCTAIARLWPYSAAWGAGTLLAQGPLAHIIGAVLLAGLLLVIQIVQQYFWNHREGA